MKARIPHEFFLYAQKHNLKSMLKATSEWAFDLYAKRDKEMGTIASYRYFTSSMQKVMIVQTRLIDMFYDLVKYNNYGSANISSEGSLTLIGLYGNYQNAIEHTLYNKNDVFLYVYGFFGEQRKIQLNLYFEEFAREKYILETISKLPDVQYCNIDYSNEFLQQTGLTTDAYSANLFIIFAMFVHFHGFVNKENVRMYFQNSPIDSSVILSIMDANSASVHEIRKHPLQRQALYAKPIVKADNCYIASNPFLLLALFANSNFWVLRNKYQQLNSLAFTNAFGVYFEKYAEEIISRCLPHTDYLKIPENGKDKRSDWKLKLDSYDMLIEQKSTLPLLRIKQNQPDLEAMKKHILKSWGEAVAQLFETERYYQSKFIKVILVYDEYFKAEALEELFKLNTDLHNDGNYWLLNIREFEMLMMLYRNNRPLFNTIMNEKISSETSFSTSGRELAIFFQQYGITQNDYLTEFGIMEEVDRVTRYYIQHEDKGQKLRET